jgi:glucosamine--fructose-6-phosphate aminotransferase (isomerizing)
MSTPEAVEDILTSSVREGVKRAADLVQAKSIVHYIGCGTSYFSSIAAVYGLHQLTNKLGLAHEAHEFASYPPSLGSDHAYVAVSHSGSTAPVMQGATLAAGSGLQGVAITDNPESELVRQVDVTLIGQYGVEPSLPKTRSFITTLLRQYMLVLALAEREGRAVGDAWEQLERLPAHVRRILDAQRDRTKDLAHRFGSVRRVVVAGGGPQYPIALEASLKLTEAAGADSAAWEIEEAGHGTWASSEATDLAVVLATSGPSRQKALNVGRAMAQLGIAVWLVSDDAEQVDWAAAQTNTGAGLSEWLMPLVSILPLYQFSYWLALEKGLNPDIMRLDDEHQLLARTIMRHPERLEGESGVN